MCHRDAHQNVVFADKQITPAVTELKEFPGRGHSLTIDSGWRELAEYSLTWLKAKGL